MIKRYDDWQLRFEKIVTENLSRPFEWGSHDCVLWGADCVLAITGHDAAENFRGTYNSALSAARVLKELGGMENAITNRLGLSPVAVGYANVGDILLADLEGQLTTTVCNGETMLATGETGLVALPTLSALKAWKV
jgi:hypothetical protein